MTRIPIAARVWRALPFWGKRQLLWLLNAHFVVGAVALIHDGNGRVLVAKHTYRGGPPWGLPGGWVRRGEDPAQTVVREIREETSLEVEIAAPLTVRSEGPAHLTLVYRARLTGGTFRPSAEVTEIQFLERGVWPRGLRADHRALIETFGWRAVSV
jgi:8-oxo-dGTP diphosphatase